MLPEGKERGRNIKLAVCVHVGMNKQLVDMNSSNTQLHTLATPFTQSYHTHTPHYPVYLEEQ